MRSLIIDNYDSYTYNLYQLIAEVSGKEPIVIKNNEMTFKEILNLDFDNVIISPGPGSPDKEKDFGICSDIILKLNKPILGICLGHQGIYYLHGGIVKKADIPMHGRLSKIYHKGKNLFKNIPNAFEVTRYHSLICEDKDLSEINIDAKTKDGVVMAISHKRKPIYGVQFHPESISSEYGNEIIKNFYEITRDFYKDKSLYWKSFDTDKDSQEIFEKLYAKYPDLLWLDSSKSSDEDRFSIFGISTNKRGHILKYDVNKNITTKIIKESGIVEDYEMDIFTYLKENKVHFKDEKLLPFNFQLGYIGYFGYELKKITENVENKNKYKYADAYLVYCDRAIVYDHLDKKIYILSYYNDKNFKG